MYSWSRPTVFECAVLAKKVEEAQNVGGSEVERGRMNIGHFSVKVKNYGSLEFWQACQRFRRTCRLHGQHIYFAG